MNDYKVKINEIEFHNGKMTKFDLPIDKLLEYKGILFIMLNTIGTVYNRNIFAVDINGNLLWQIEESKNLDIIGDCPFTSFEIRNDKLSLFNFCGFRFTVNIDNGKVLEQVFTK